MHLMVETKNLKGELIMKLITDTYWQYEIIVGPKTLRGYIDSRIGAILY